MRDARGIKINVGDTLEQLVTDDLHIKGTEWLVIGIGIEPSTNTQIAVMQSPKKYIMCAWQIELKFFKKKEGAVC